MIDLIISCMRSGSIPHENPQIGDWCIEISSFTLANKRDYCIGKLVSITDQGKYTIETVSKKIVNWENASFIKILDKYIR